MKFGKVEKGVEISTPNNRCWVILAKRLKKVGDSVSIELEKGENIKKVQCSAIISLGYERTGIKITTRKISKKELRIWRIK